MPFVFFFNNLISTPLHQPLSKVSVLILDLCSLAFLSDCFCLLFFVPHPPLKLPALQQQESPRILRSLRSATTTPYWLCCWSGLLPLLALRMFTFLCQVRQSRLNLSPVRIVFAECVLFVVGSIPGVNLFCFFVDVYFSRH